MRTRVNAILLEDVTTGKAETAKPPKRYEEPMRRKHLILAELFLNWARPGYSSTARIPESISHYKVIFNQLIQFTNHQSSMENGVSLSFRLFFLDNHVYVKIHTCVRIFAASREFKNLPMIFPNRFFPTLWGWCSMWAAAALSPVLLYKAGSWSFVSWHSTSSLFLPSFPIFLLVKGNWLSENQTFFH